MIATSLSGGNSSPVPRGSETAATARREGRKCGVGQRLWVLKGTGSPVKCKK
jgi:hypothetical protein